MTVHASRASWLARIFLVLGILFSLYLFQLVQDEVFISGDGGVKALLTRQYASGDISTALHLEGEPWVQDLWDEGLFPLKPPFVYERDGEQLVGFPILFSLISAPFYKLFGFKGLYVIPMLSLWILWVRFILVARKRAMNARTVAISMGLLILTTPLTLYGAMFWEHTLGALLIFMGFEFFIDRGRHPLPVKCALPWGLLAGLSAWLRSEALVMLGLFLFVCVIMWLRDKRKDVAAFGLGLALSVLSLWLANFLLYGHFLGLHSLQVMGAFSFADRVDHGIDILRALSGMLVIFFPIVVFLLLFLPMYVASQDKRAPTPSSLFMALSGAYLFLVPFLLPLSGGDQYGPRFLLLIMPPLCLVCGVFIRDMSALRERSRILFMKILLIVTAAFGVYINVICGAEYMKENYGARVQPALEFLREQESTVVAVSHQWVAQELEAGMEDKVFFRTERRMHFETLARGLLKQDIRHFVYLDLADPRHEATKLQPLRAEGLAASAIEMQRIGVFGDYIAYHAAIVTTHED